MTRWLRDNGLTLAYLVLFLASWAGTSVSGLSEHNEERAEHDEPAIAYGEYVTSAHFWQATLENWQSEWLQMATFVWFTTFLYQRGSPESKKLDGTDEVNKDPRRHRQPNSPWPVRRGGLALLVYENSLTLVLVALFVVSWTGHAIAGAAVYSDDQVAHGGPATGVAEYLATSRFWFETLQNWQSEWLSIATLVFLGIYLRQRGSVESKPVFSSHRKTGNE
jgi:hypothetical protein